jgi:pentapeptide repeat protein
MGVSLSDDLVVPLRSSAASAVKSFFGPQLYRISSLRYSTIGASATSRRQLPFQCSGEPPREDSGAIELNLKLAAVLLILLIAVAVILWSRQRHKADRLPYAESCRVLQGAGLLEADSIPPMPAKAPRYDDDVLGLEFFRTQVAGVKLENLTLPRTFFGRSEIRKVSFRGTDLGESTACWNDFIDVDFSRTCLRQCDLRGSSFERVVFDGADLTNADLRRSKFSGCTFRGATLSGAKLSATGARAISLSPEQLAELDFQEDEGPEPPGG